jgi:hypothetical protein
LINELDRAKNNMNLAREHFFEAVDQSWDTIEKNNIVSDEQLNGVSITSHCRQALSFMRINGSKHRNRN